MDEVKKETFCWLCHKDGELICCNTCPRAYHLKCVTLNKSPVDQWICPECCLILHAENMTTRSPSMKSLSLNQLCNLLKFTLDRMKNTPQSEAFWKPVDSEEFPLYRKYISNPMDLNMLEKNIKAKMYGSTEAFLADTKWLFHNSVIFNSTQSTLTNTARFLVKICKQEMTEIENCPDCYLNAHTIDDWFIEICRSPHLLVWARLKGFPFWPAKVMTTNMKTQQVDVRFFGAHDKAWIPIKECYILSRNPPQPTSKKRAEWEDANQDVLRHITKLKQKFGEFRYGADKTPYDPECHSEHLKFMLPDYNRDCVTYKPDRFKMGSPKKVKRKRKSSTDESAKSSNSSSGSSSDIEKQFKIKIPKISVVPPFRINKEVIDRGSESDDVCPSPSNLNNSSSHGEDVGETQVCPEDEIADTLLKYSTSKTTMVEVSDDDTPSESAEVESGIEPTPEHGYSRAQDENNIAEASSTSNATVDGCDIAQTKMEESEPQIEPQTPEKDDTENICQEVIAELLEKVECSEIIQVTEEKKIPKVNVVEKRRKSKEQEKEVKTVRKIKKTETKEKKQTSEKKENKKEEKVFSNLSKEVKEKMVGETRLLANIDEMSDGGKEALLLELGLEATKVNVKQIAEENRQILNFISKTQQINANRELKKESVEPESTPDQTDSKPLPNKTVKSSSEKSKKTDKNNLKVYKRKTEEPKPPDTQPKKTEDTKISDTTVLQQKSLTMLQSTSNGQIILTNNNLVTPVNKTVGQLSLVHLTNLTSGIQTNFVNLANETIGSTLYAAPTTSANSVVITGVPLVNKTKNEVIMTRIASSTPPPSLPPPSGKSISVKSPASLGITKPPPPPLIVKPGAQVVSSSSSLLGKHTEIISNHVKTALEEILNDIGNQGCLEAKYKSLQIEMERLQWRHQQEVLELKQELIELRHNSERNLAELRTNMENDKQKSLLDLKCQMETRQEKIISETKRKQWCANCGKEALFYCCWNTSYCDYPCQQQHWPGHMSTCAQLGNNAAPPASVASALNAQNKAVKYSSPTYVPIIPRISSSQQLTALSDARTISSVQMTNHHRRLNNGAGLVTIRPQHYYV